MRIAAFQFASSGSVEDNLRHICRGVENAAQVGAHLVCFHECALCGYPPIEVRTEDIDEEAIAAAMEEVSALAVKHCIHILLGTVLTEGEKRYNSAVMYAPDGHLTARYDKKALWGWDCDNFEKGSRSGTFETDGVRIGVRICFDVRFPELFRELYRERIDLCVVLFSDTAERPDPERYAIIKGHLVTRAAENVMTVLSVNSFSRFQTAPTAVIDHNGRTVAEACPDREDMVVFDFTPPAEDFGMKGRRTNSDALLKNETDGQIMKIREIL